MNYNKLTELVIKKSAKRVFNQLIDSKSVVCIAITIKENGKYIAIIPEILTEKTLNDCISILELRKMEILQKAAETKAISKSKINDN